jgi:hypothetical protein
MISEKSKNTAIVFFFSSFYYSQKGILSILCDYEYFLLYDRNMCMYATVEKSFYEIEIYTYTK